MCVRTMCLAALVALAGCSSGGSSSGSPPPPPPAATAPAITAQPASVTVTAGQPATFSVSASGSAPFTYQWRRDGLDIAGATSASYTASAVAMGDNGVSYTAVVTNGGGSVTSAAAILTVMPAANNATSIELGQTTALLTGVGQTRLLAATAIDAQGAPVTGAVTWETSNASAVAVDASGRITAQAIGSAMLFARLDGLRSQPVFVLVAEPQSGALVVNDEQVVAVGSPIGLAEGVVPGVGTRYEVTVTGIAAAPAAGTVVVSSGDSPVAGKVVSTRNEAGNLVLLLELASLPDLLARYDIDLDIDLSTIPVESIEIEDTPATFTKEGIPRFLARSQTQAVGDFRAFSCEGTAGLSLFSTRISLTPHIEAHLQIESHRDNPALPPGYGKIALVGSQSLRGLLELTLNVGFGGSASCIAQTKIKIPVSGLLSILVVPALRIGVGVELEGYVHGVTAKLSASGTMGATEMLGFECRALPAGCQALSDVTMIDEFKFEKQVPSENDLHIELSGQVFALAGIDAVFLLGAYTGEIVDARVGPKQSFNLAYPGTQAENASMASHYEMTLDAEIKPGDALAKSIKKLVGDDEVTLNFAAPYSRPIAASPKGTLDLSTNSVAFGQPVELQVNLDLPLTYPLLGVGGATAYNVKSIRLYRKKLDGPTWAEWRNLPAAQGQSIFQTSWTPTAEEQGDYEFTAFVETLMPLPVLEIAEDTRKPLHVRGPGWHGNVHFNVQGTESTNVTTGSASTVTTFTDTGNGSYQLEVIPGTEGAPILNVMQGSGTLSKVTVEQYDNHYVFGGCNITVTQTREMVEQGALQPVAGNIALIMFQPDGAYQITIPNMVGVSTLTTHTVASESSTGPNCHAPDPTDTTTTIESTIRTATLTVNGVAGPNPTELSGSAIVSVEGLPDVQYTVNWTLVQ